LQSHIKSNRAISSQSNSKSEESKERTETHKKSTSNSSKSKEKSEPNQKSSSNPWRHSAGSSRSRRSSRESSWTTGWLRYVVVGLTIIIITLHLAYNEISNYNEQPKTSPQQPYYSSIHNKELIEKQTTNEQLRDTISSSSARPAPSPYKALSIMDPNITSYYQRYKSHEKIILKCALVLLGYELDYKTDQWDGNTDYVVRDFQEKNNLKPDGKVGTRTIQAMADSIKELEDLDEDIKETIYSILIDIAQKQEGLE
jgi:hypothetical protein